MKKKFLCLLMFVTLLLFPMTVWAAEVPEVTDEEYRFFLEYLTSEYLGIKDYSSYSDEELKSFVKDTFSANGGDYREVLEHNLLTAEQYENEDFTQYSEAQLEAFATKVIVNYMDELILHIEKYDNLSIPELDSPQKNVSATYKALLEKDYHMTEGLEDLQWYQLQDLYYRVGLQQDIRTEFGYDKDLSEYTYDELWDLYTKLGIEKNLREEYQVTKDLSAYSFEELREMEYRLEIEKDLRTEFQVTEDLSGYTLEELDKMYWDLHSENMEKEWAIQKDFERTKVDILINGKMMKYTDEKEDTFFWIMDEEEDGYTSDVRPVIKEDRVYIPFRAVFEALGAEVSYDSKTGTVKAQRNEKTVEFTAGEPHYVMNGTTIHMDAKAFVQDNRTYVPVRFASQALGAAVGWDADARTVVILEKDKIMNRYKGQFTVLERYLQHWNLGEGNVAVKGNVQLDMLVQGEDQKTGERMEIPAGITLEMSELTSRDIANMDMAVKMNIDKVLALLKQDGILNTAAMQTMDAIKDFRVQYIVDIVGGKFYIKSDLMTLVQGSEDKWYYLDIEEYLNQEEYEQYMDVVQELLKEIEKQNLTEMDAALALTIQNLNLNNADEVKSVLESLDLILYAVGDKWLGKIENGYQRHVKNDIYDVKLVFYGNQNQIDGLSVSLDMNEQYTGSNLNFVMEEKNHEIDFSMDFSMKDYESSVTMTCQGNYKYQLTDETPAIKPDANSKTEDLVAFFQAAGIW